MAMAEFSESVCRSGRGFPVDGRLSGQGAGLSGPFVSHRQHLAFSSLDFAGARLSRPSRRLFHSGGGVLEGALSGVALLSLGSLGESMSARLRAPNARRAGAIDRKTGSSAPLPEMQGPGTGLGQFWCSGPEGPTLCAPG